MTRDTVDLTPHADGSGSTLFRGLLTLGGGGSENLPNAQSGTDNVGEPLAVGSEWIAITDTPLVDAQGGSKAVPVDAVVKLKTANPTNVDDFVVMSSQGVPGDDGADGKSAYDLALDGGFSGSEAAWLVSLKGEAGDNGTNGKSAYELAVEGGYVGTVADWLISIEGNDGADGNDGSDGAAGKSAYELAVDGGYSDSVTEWLLSLQGQDGSDGVDGSNGLDGSDGDSAYEIAVADGYSGTISEWLESLKGQDGQDGTAAALDRDDYAAVTPEVVDEVLFADDSDANNFKRATWAAVRTMLGIANRGLYRGYYTPPAPATTPEMPSQTSGSVTALHSIPQATGDLYIVDTLGEIGTPQTSQEVYPGDMLFVNAAPASSVSDVDIVPTGQLFTRLIAESTPITSALLTDQLLAVRAGTGRVLTFEDLVTAVKAVDDTFSATEIAALRAELNPRKPTKVARMIMTAEVSAGTNIELDGSDAFATLLTGSDVVTLPATDAEFRDNHDYKVYVDGLLVNKVLDNNTFEISNPLAFRTVSRVSTTTIEFTRSLPDHTVVEVHHDNAPESAGVTPPPPPPAAITAAMGSAATIELAGFYPGATYSVVSVTGDGTAEIRGTELIYQSGVESGTQTVTYRATQGATTNDATLDVLLTDTFTLADAKTFVSYDIENLVARADEFSGNQTLVYSASYVALALRNLFQGTGDSYYFDQFKDYITRAIASATTVVTTVLTGNPVQSNTPHEDYGGSGTYTRWGLATPNPKATDQFAFAAMLFLFDIIDERGEAAQSAGILSAADKTWAENTAYPFFSQLIESNRTMGGDNGITMVYVADSARTRVANPASVLRWGYWSSNVGVAMAAGLVEIAIRDSMALAEKSYWATQEAFHLAGNPGNPYGTPRDWYDWWKESIEYDGTRATWDVANPNLQTTNGWGFPGQTKAPDIGHGFGRYGFIAWFMEYAGQDAGAAVINAGFDQQFDEVVVLPPDYVTPDGDHAGEIADGIQLANYINGDDGPFRDYISSAGSTAGMASMVYYSQRGFKRPESREALARLFRQGMTWIGPTSPNATGTAERHQGHTDYNDPAGFSQSYAGPALLGNFLAATKQPLT